MELDVKIVLHIYKEEIAKLQNENILLKAEIVQMREQAKAQEKNQAIECQEGDE